MLSDFSNADHELMIHIYTKEISQPHSFGRIPDGGNLWQTFSSPSPGSTNQPNSQENTERIKANISISEVFPCPGVGQTEWVELYNHENVDFTILNWTIIDSSNNKKDINLSIPAQGYIVLEIDHPILNNSGDSINLHNTSQEVIDHMSYDNCHLGSSWIKHNGSWAQTTSVTKGSSNTPIPPKLNQPKTLIKQTIDQR